ncbi:MAG TPA: hypothetical protein VHR66_13425 [Gemmataceae bacterium]|jgi:hypothetical protein|nr:hypothetical protein [Gemmataceae bacterium]
MSFGPDDPYDDRERRPRSRYDPRFDDARWGDYRDDYDDEPLQTDPREKVRLPATILLIVSITGLVLTVTGLALAGVAGFLNPPPRPEIIVNVIFGALIGTIALAYFSIMAFGAARMRQCRSYGISMAAVIMAISSIAILGLCGFFIVPFGVWGLVIIVQADVKREFDRRRKSYE